MSLTSDALDIWNAGVGAAHAGRLVQKHVSVNDGFLRIGNDRFKINRPGNICIVGAGKAAYSMAEGLLQVLEPINRDRIFGQINVREAPAGIADSLIKIRRVNPFSTNLPSSEAVAATVEIRRVVSQLQPNDLCIALISGGCSALLCEPASGISLSQKVEITNLLSAGAANIEQLNTVRQCLSKIKAGGLASACNAGSLATLILSDVIGDDVRVIGSGPTITCELNYERALQITRRFDTDSKTPDGVVQFLKRQIEQGMIHKSESKATVFHTIIGNTQTAIDGAAEVAKALGYHVITDLAVPPEPLEKKSRQLVSRLANQLQKTCIISGGEPTLQLAQEIRRGKGGRNQQLAVQAMVDWQGLHPKNERPFCLLSGGTDGQDGNTTFAGGWCDNQTVRSADLNSLDPEQFLSTNDTATFLNQTNSLISSGPTGTNVCDLRVFVSDGVIDS